MGEDPESLASRPKDDAARCCGRNEEGYDMHGNITSLREALVVMSRFSRRSRYHPERLRRCLASSCELGNFLAPICPSKFTLSVCPNRNRVRLVYEEKNQTSLMISYLGFWDNFSIWKHLWSLPYSARYAYLPPKSFASNANRTTTRG